MGQENLELSPTHDASIISGLGGYNVQHVYVHDDNGTASRVAYAFRPRTRLEARLERNNYNPETVIESCYPRKKYA